jgi:hypothetical protein
MGVILDSSVVDSVLLPVNYKSGILLNDRRTKTKK